MQKKYYIFLTILITLGITLGIMLIIKNSLIPFQLKKELIITDDILSIDVCLINDRNHPSYKRYNLSTIEGDINKNTILLSYGKKVKKIKKENQHFIKCYLETSLHPNQLFVYELDGKWYFDEKYSSENYIQD